MAPWYGVDCTTTLVFIISSSGATTRGSIIFAAARVQEIVDGVPHLGVKGSRNFADNASAQKFNTYFRRYLDHAASVEGQKPLSMDTSWTPKRRRKELNDDAGSQRDLATQTFDATPPKL